MEQTIQRKHYYALLSRVLMEESDETLVRSVMENEQLMAFLPELAEEKAAIMADPKKYVEEQLNVDFTDFFLLHAVPYESFYKSEEGVINTGGSNPVVRFYEEYDFQADLAKARVVSADHIGVELEFMHLLVESELKAREQGDEAAARELVAIEKQFMKEHLLTFAPLFLETVRTEAVTAWYRAFAELALDFLFADFEAIGEKLA